MFGIGNDLVHIPRIAKIVGRFGEKFLKKVLHPQEHNIYVKHLKSGKDCKSSAQYLASRWAVKEAVHKAFGGPRIPFPDIYVKRTGSGKPELEFDGLASSLIKNFGIERTHVTIAHDHEYAIATVVLEKRRDFEFASK
eukprot:TRINITY_DN8336_c0_g1_i1.p1 TRINITY_DN8336_c0_g1~~TRINITY_DN8336_c0_g1_i1.p1  ORF type:complete len:138 (+),score=21.05 TRINITY_DN8336_c0_g1_i1:33-446(+)